MKMNDATARTMILKGGRTSEPLHVIACGIDRNGESILSVAAELVRDILFLSWPAERNDGAITYGPSGARQVSNDLYSRTFLPEDIPASEESPLACLGSATPDPEIKARIYDVLYERFKKNEYAKLAIDSLADCLSSYKDASEWICLYHWSDRAVFLSGRLGDASTTRTVLAAVTKAVSLILGGNYPAAISRFAAVLCGSGAKHLRDNGILEKSTICRWAETINLVAIHHRQRHEWMHIEQLRNAESDLWKLAGEPIAQKKALRTLVEEYFIESADNEEVALIRLQSAMSLAAAKGFKDLLARAKQLLPSAIERETANMRGRPITLEIDHKNVMALDDLLDHAVDISTALRALASLSSFTTLPIKELTEASKRALTASPFYALVSSTTLRNCNIAHIAPGGTDAKIKSHLSQVLPIHLAKIEKFASHSLAVLFNKGVEEHSLFEALLDPAWARPARLEQFRRASSHFAKGSWYEAGMILALSYEGFLRDWLRSVGYSAVKYDSDGTTSDEMLNSLVWNHQVEELLGPEYLGMVRFLLCDPELGMNLRNEIAHANADPRVFPPAIVLMIALLIVRLTLLRADQQDTADEETIEVSYESSDSTAMPLSGNEHPPPT